MAKAGKDAQEDIMRRANTLLTRSVKQTTPYSFEFDAESDAIVNFITQNALSKSKYVVGTQAQEIRNLIVASRDIDNLTDLSTQINQAFGDDAVTHLIKIMQNKIAKN